MQQLISSIEFPLKFVYFELLFEQAKNMYF